MLIKLYLLVTSILIFQTNTYATKTNDPELTEIQKSMLLAARMAVEIEHIASPEIFTFNGNVFDDQGKFIEQRWSVTGSEGEQTRLVEFSIKIIQNPSTPSTVQAIIEMSCKRTKTYHLGLYGGKITHIGLDQRFSSFKIESDSRGNVIGLESDTYNPIAQTKKGRVFKKNRYQMKYSDKNELIEIQSFEMLGEGPDYKTIKDKAEEKTGSKKIEYSGGGLGRTVRIVRKEGKKVIDTSHLYKYENGIEIRTQLNNGQNLYGTKREEVIKITRNEKQLAIKVERTLRNELNYFEDVEVMEYDLNNRLIKKSSLQRIDNKFSAHTISEYTYKPVNGVENIKPCSGDPVDVYSQSLDNSSNVISERRNSKERVKNANGEWSDWKQMQY